MVDDESSYVSEGTRRVSNVNANAVEPSAHTERTETISNVANFVEETENPQALVPFEGPTSSQYADELARQDVEPNVDPNETHALVLHETATPDYSEGLVTQTSGSGTYEPTEEPQDAPLPPASSESDAQLSGASATSQPSDVSVGLGAGPAGTAPYALDGMPTYDDVAGTPQENALTPQENSLTPQENLTVSEATTSQFAIDATSDATAGIVEQSQALVPHADGNSNQYSLQPSGGAAEQATANFTDADFSSSTLGTTNESHALVPHESSEAPPPQYSGYENTVPTNQNSGHESSTLGQSYSESYRDWQNYDTNTLSSKLPSAQSDFQNASEHLHGQTTGYSNVDPNASTRPANYHSDSSHSGGVSFSETVSLTTEDLYAFRDERNASVQQSHQDSRESSYTEESRATSAQSSSFAPTQASTTTEETEEDDEEQGSFYPDEGDFDDNSTINTYGTSFMNTTNMNNGNTDNLAEYPYKPQPETIYEEDEEETHISDTQSTAYSTAKSMKSYYDEGSYAQSQQTKSLDDSSQASWTKGGKSYDDDQSEASWNKPSFDDKSEASWTKPKPTYNDDVSVAQSTGSYDSRASNSSFHTSSHRSFISVRSGASVISAVSHQSDINTTISGGNGLRVVQRPSNSNLVTRRGDSREVEVSMDGFMHQTKTKVSTNFSSSGDDGDDGYPSTFSGDGQKSKVSALYLYTTLFSVMSLMGTVLFFTAHIGPFIVDPAIREGRATMNSRPASMLGTSTSSNQEAIYLGEEGGVVGNHDGNHGGNGGNLGADIDEGGSTNQWGLATDGEGLKVTGIPQWMSQAFKETAGAYVGAASEIPFVWSLDRSGGEVVSETMARCLSKVIAGNGKRYDHNQHKFTEFEAEVMELKKLSNEDGFTYINVDLFSPVGIDRAANLQLTHRGISEILHSPFLRYSAEKMFSPEEGEKYPKVKGRMFLIARDPVERAINMYHATKELTGNDKLTLQEFSVAPIYRENNPLTRAVLGIATDDPLEASQMKIAKLAVQKYAVVGLISERDATITRYEKFLGWTPANYDATSSCRENLWSTQYEQGYTITDDYKTTDPIGYNALAANYGQDLILYKYILELFELQGTPAAETLTS